MADNPAQTTLHLAEILGTFMSGYLCACEPFHGQDQADVEAWKEAYLRCGELSDWLSLKASVERGLITWARYPAVGRALDTMAGILVQARELRSRSAAESLLAAADVWSVPQPLYTVQAPARTRWGLDALRTAARTAARTLEVPRVSGRGEQHGVARDGGGNWYRY
jgi:hypothetical protein